MGQSTFYPDLTVSRHAPGAIYLVGFIAEAGTDCNWVYWERECRTS
jgi:hypothetical protein